MTKADTIEQKDLARRHYLIKQQLEKQKRSVDKIMMCSARTMAGMSDLRKELAKIG
jgi:hypothetical protein